MDLPSTKTSKLNENNKNRKTTKVLWSIHFECFNIILVDHKTHEIIYWFHIFDRSELNTLGLAIRFYVINPHYIGVLRAIEPRCFVNAACNAWRGHLFITEKSGCFLSKTKSHLLSDESKLFALRFVIDLPAEKKLLRRYRRPMANVLQWFLPCQYRSHERIDVTS